MHIICKNHLLAQHSPAHKKCVLFLKWLLYYYGYYITIISIFFENNFFEDNFWSKIFFSGEIKIKLKKSNKLRLDVWWIFLLKIFVQFLRKKNELFTFEPRSLEEWDNLINATIDLPTMTICSKLLNLPIIGLNIETPAPVLVLVLH